MSDEPIFLLIVPIRAKIKLSAIQQINQKIQNQHFKFQLSKNRLALGKTESFLLTNEKTLKNEYSESGTGPTSNEEEREQFFTHEFDIKKNVIFYKDYMSNFQDAGFTWSILVASGQNQRKRELKIFSHECSFKEAISLHVTHEAQFKFRQWIYFGRNEAELEYKIFIQKKVEKILHLRRRIQREDAQDLIKSISVKKNRGEAITDQNQAAKIQINQIMYQQNQIKEENAMLKRKEHMQFKKKFLKVTPLHKTNLVPHRSEQDHMCETLSLSIPKSPIEKFATPEEEQQFNQKLQSYLRVNNQQDLFLAIFRKKNIIILVILLIIVLFFVSQLYFNQEQEPKNKRKRHRKTKKTNHRTKYKGKSRQAL